MKYDIETRPNWNLMLGFWDFYRATC